MVRTWSSIIPVPDRGRKGTDFGQGFYLTPDITSAVNMAHRVARRKNASESVVMCYALAYLYDMLLEERGMPR